MTPRAVLLAALCASAHARSALTQERPSLRVKPHRLTTPDFKAEQALARLRGGAAAATEVASTNALSFIANQIAYEISHCQDSPAKFFGFVGACCNWFLGLSAVLDASRLGPEVIQVPMTLVLLMYSLLFGRWAGWDVSPKNFILSGSHMFNVCAQLYQLRRALIYKLDTQPGAKEEIAALGTKAAGAVAVIAAYIAAAPKLKAMMPEGSFLASAGGPFTVHPWPPVTKLFLSLNSLMDLHKPTEKISLAQFAALTLTGFIFTFYGLYVTPINYPLTSVNILLFLSSAWHLGRKIKADYID